MWTHDSPREAAERADSAHSAWVVTFSTRLRRALLAAILAVAAMRAQATGSIRGRIVDRAGRPIAGAQVALTPGERRVVSDDDGTVFFGGLAPGSYTLSVRRIGYESKSATVALRDSVAEAVITLVEIPLQLDSVRIRGKSSGLRYSAVVLDQYDTPVAGADVIAMGINGGIATDSAGRISFDKISRGTLIVRARKIGYAPALASLRMLADRADTLRMARLPRLLSEVEIKEASGYGMDFWAYRELQQRMAWKSAMAGAVSREELDERGKEDLCDALPGTASGARLSLHNDPYCKTFPRGLKYLLIDGAMCRRGLLSDYDADEVETVEVMPSDMSGSLKARRCGPPAYVIWLRKEPPRMGGAPGPDVPRTIVGSVYDSVTNRPLGGAHVHLADLSRDAVTDSLGSFRFDGVGAGVHALWADHPEIDRLGLFTVTGSIDVTPQVVSRETLATPSFETLWRRACAGAPPADSGAGFVYGRVVVGGPANPAAGELVRVVSHAAPDGAGAHARDLEREAVTGGDGTYAVCGIPVARSVSLAAGRGDTATTPVALLVGEARVARRDITMPSTATLARIDADSSEVAPLSGADGAVLAGTLVDSAGKPVPSARIKISGVAGEWGVAAGGAFAVHGIPPGAHVVAVSAVGFIQERRYLDAAPADSFALDLPMTRLATTLNTVTVLAERARVRMDALQRDLTTRRSAGFGHWVDSLALEKAFSVQQTLTFPRVNVVTTQGQWSIYMVSGVLTMPQNGKSGGSQTCTPTYWLDGDLTDVVRLNDLSKNEIGLIEVYPTAAGAPLQYTGTRSNCGVVLFWRKRFISP